MAGTFEQVTTPHPVEHLCPACWEERAEVLIRNARDLYALRRKQHAARFGKAAADRALPPRGTCICNACERDRAERRIAEIWKTDRAQLAIHRAWGAQDLPGVAA